MTHTHLWWAKGTTKSVYVAKGALFHNITQEKHLTQPSLWLLHTIAHLLEAFTHLTQPPLCTICRLQIGGIGAEPLAGVF